MEYASLDGICQSVHEYAFRQRPIFGYLFTCPRTGAWRGSVQVPGSSLSIRLPALVVWLSFGLRGPGAAGSEERLKRGLPKLEVAVPSWLGNDSTIE
jgi:hypothetical protein